MCGILFVDDSNKTFTKSHLSSALHRQTWRGPDNTGEAIFNEGRVYLGHNRLSIIAPEPTANQPMQTDRYAIIFNGEIYNYKYLQNHLRLECSLDSDTEVLLRGFEMIGVSIFPLLEGMFALVIYDKLKNTWHVARDHAGIKPLFYHQTKQLTVFASEPSAINNLISSSIDYSSIEEWKLVRRPAIGYTFFEDIFEFPCASYKSSYDSNPTKYWSPSESSVLLTTESYSREIASAVNSHLVGDCAYTTLLSGGLDSAVITKIANPSMAYTVGLDTNNEFSEAYDTAVVVGCDLKQVCITIDQLNENWKYLTQLRGEPLSLPNEALIYEVCRATQPEQKIILSGEGADETLLGYSRIFEWADNISDFTPVDFLLRYGYCNKIHEPKLGRLIDYIIKLKDGKTPFEFVEDFFLGFHLPCLLRRMDFASMAASKEVRVPFVSKRLISLCYRQNVELRMGKNYINPKKPLRELSRNLGLVGASRRKKIGFEASSHRSTPKSVSYSAFQSSTLSHFLK
ncbi:asparagine synthetase B [Synechococcus sp. LA31]|uniref:asparagine synthetase B family protein n=1 Tax=Synechococcus sp. LA31 TaxID=2741953 RepID=UPI001BDD4428|nr:asparagine synthetase B [Synechococcus sp. LA31]QVV68736.1 asparagine synthetase B [Synechococcus sp. LA31]